MLQGLPALQLRAGAVQKATVRITADHRIGQQGISTLLSETVELGAYAGSVVADLHHKLAK